jgi:hypothetical protein
MTRLTVTLALAILMGGCASPKFAAPKYLANPARFGPIQLVTTNKVYVSRVIDRLGDDNRKFIDPKFSTTAYLTDALDQELTAAGVTPLATPFAVGPGFNAAQQTIAAQANKQEGAVYLISEVRWFGPVKLTLDAKLYSPSGTILFEKRGLCIMLNVRVDSQTITHMALRQIIADPAFQTALQ